MRFHGILLLLMAVGRAGAGGKDEPLFFDAFDKGARRWQPMDPAAWKVERIGDKHAYSQFQQSKTKPPFRSPFNFALVKDLQVTDFVLDAQVKSTARDYDHRDVCLFLGYQDASHYYYVHLAKKADDRANQVFIVNSADRKKISAKSTPGTPWDEAWHHVRVVRTVADGGISVYFDDMKTPIMAATDRTFAWGQVGIGSFDDTSMWTDVLLTGTVRPK